jgi:hypothetical protein
MKHSLLKRNLRVCKKFLKIWAFPMIPECIKSEFPIGFAIIVLRISQRKNKNTCNKMRKNEKASSKIASKPECICVKITMEVIENIAFLRPFPSEFSKNRNAKSSVENWQSQEDHDQLQTGLSFPIIIWTEDSKE